MKLLRFRIAGTFTGTFAVGPNNYTAGQEFTLRDDQARRWISESDIQGGYVVPLGEAGGEAGAYMDANTAAYIAGKDGDTGGIRQDEDRFTVTLNPTFVATGATGIAKFRPDCACAFLAVEFPQISASALAANEYKIDLRKYTNGLTDAGSLLEVAGTNSQAATGVLFYDASAASYTDETADAASAGANDVVLSSMQTNDYLYIGWYAPFDGFVITGDAFNGNAADMTVQYPSVAADGTVTWTSMTVTDGSANGGATFGQAGAVTWEKTPGDWKRMAIRSTASATLAYWVRISVSAALDSSTTLSTIKLITRVLPPYDNTTYKFQKGDVVSVDSPVYTAVAGTAQTIVLHFARIR